MISVRKALSLTGSDMGALSTWIDRGLGSVKLSGLDLPIGPVISEVEGILNNFLKAPVEEKDLTLEILSHVFISVTMMQGVKYSKSLESRGFSQGAAVGQLGQGLMTAKEKDLAKIPPQSIPKV